MAEQNPPVTTVDSLVGLTMRGLVWTGKFVGVILLSGAVLEGLQFLESLVPSFGWLFYGSQVVVALVALGGLFWLIPDWVPLRVNFGSKPSARSNAVQTYLLYRYFR